MQDQDLPEPRRINYTPEQQRERQRRLLIALLGFSVAYSLLHKLLIPVFLKLTPLSASPYAKLDPWFLHSLILFAWVFHRRQLGAWGSLLAGAGIAYGVFEIFELFSGRLVGWLAFSRLLSSVPVAFCCGLMMTTSHLDRRFTPAWLGAILALALLLTSHLNQKETVKASIALRNKEAISDKPEETCGATTVTMDSSHPVARDVKISIRKCGFFPSSIRNTTGFVQLRNETDQALNVHCLTFRNGKAVGGWNFVLKGKQSATRSLDIADAAILYSDSAPGAGISALLSEKSTGRWVFTRNPISIRVSP